VNLSIEKSIKNVIILTRVLNDLDIKKIRREMIYEK